VLDFVYCNDLLILIYCAKLYNYFAFLNLKCWSLGIYTTIFKHFAAVNVFNIACAVWCNRNQWTFRHNTIITMDLAKAAALHVSSQISHEREKLTSNDALHNTCRSKKKKKNYDASIGHYYCYSFVFPSVFWTQGCRGCGIQVGFTTCWCLCTYSSLWNR